MSGKPQILVIDNNKNILWAFKKFLLKNKLNMVGKSTIDEGLKILNEKNFDLIIFDIRSDIKGGINFIQEANKRINNIPIIITTSYPDIISAKILRKYGIDYLFIKPPDLRNLQTAIIKCLHIELNNQSKKLITH